jgi:hypothetical protein
MSWLGGSGIGYPYWLGQNPQPQPYGSFSSSASQTVLGANLTTIITYDTTEAASQTYYSGGKVYVQATGIYRVLYSLQMDTSSGGSQTVRIWLRQNGSNVARSASFFSIANNGENVATCEYIISLLAGDYVEIAFQSSDANMTASYFAAGGTGANAYPITPSIITNIYKIA